jgi:hypothetical protein
VLDDFPVRVQAEEVRDESFFAVGHDGVVLGVRGADVFLDRFPRPAVVEHQRVELLHHALLPL